MSSEAAPIAPTPDDKDWTVVIDQGCAECGFDSSFDVATTGGRIRATIPRWESVLTRTDVRTRPRADVWSPLEYAAHVRDVQSIFGARLALMLARDGAGFANWDQDAAAVEGRYSQEDPAEVAVDYAAEAGRTAALFDTVQPKQLQNRGVRRNGAVFTVETFAAYLVHDLEHHLHDVGG